MCSCSREDALHSKHLPPPGNTYDDESLAAACSAIIVCLFTRTPLHVIFCVLYGIKTSQAHPVLIPYLTVLRTGPFDHHLRDGEQHGGRLRHGRPGRLQRRERRDHRQGRGRCHRKRVSDGKKRGEKRRKEERFIILLRDAPRASRERSDTFIQRDESKNAVRPSVCLSVVSGVQQTRAPCVRACVRACEPA